MRLLGAKNGNQKPCVASLVGTKLNKIYQQPAGSSGHVIIFYAVRKEGFADSDPVPKMVDRRRQPELKFLFCAICVRHVKLLI